ncbi:8-amino-7-oxononanoate synthase [Tamlana sp. 2201CG12-4]|uniref:aminotransferase class I/II-fold pyridoxal phosphate-dependent enzyme n=1 Tax=Tamlana sp. 2201CG12-4 TaxID=3112582 RepID=UPI002DBF4D6C|nr:8-amino-7-oxononanoate synthase [Tamlana sp. 2201CG12-4]MEC3906462.1 8-amino-7-oxononanoate synthase [Tamlana sp. 2201CG12-4]
MKKLPAKLQQKIDHRKANNALRELHTKKVPVDFSSNDYLGFSKSKSIFNESHRFLTGHDIFLNGATGSRLLSGNHNLFTIIEAMLSGFHNSDAALLFNSGYDANIGFFSSVPQRGDLILYDEYSHASIRDGISMCHAKAYKFKHNDLSALERLMRRYSKSDTASYDHIYIVTESVFSMDGDSPDLAALSSLCKTYNAFLVVDEAHAIGVFGERGEGLIQSLGLEPSVFARIVTYGKALGCHGAAILCSEALKQYLINFSRSFIYTTALPPHSLATIQASYNALIHTVNRKTLQDNIQLFKTRVSSTKLKPIFIESFSAIHCCIIPGNSRVKSIAKHLQESGFDVKPILSPTVPKGQERLRFCLHAYNTEKEIMEVLQLLTTFV